jgi:hypothetical protein
VGMYELPEVATVVAAISACGATHTAVAESPSLGIGADGGGGSLGLDNVGIPGGFCGSPPFELVDVEEAADVRAEAWAMTLAANTAVALAVDDDAAAAPSALR